MSTDGGDSNARTGPWPWQAPSAPPHMPTGEIHLWRAELDIGDAALERAIGLLAVEERQRAERFIRATVRRHFTAGRAFLRRVLAGYCGSEPGGMKFCYGLHGKPALADRPGLHFNLSHSRGRAILAVTGLGELGVDLEELRHLANWEGIARRFFSTTEVVELCAVDAAQRERAFFNCWTRKEAFIKASGEGLSRPLDKFAVSLRPGEAAELRHVAGHPEEPARWRMWGLEPWPAYVACLATAAGAGKLTCFDFEWGK